MSTLYNLAIVGAGLSSLSALRAGLANEQTIVFDYQDAPGGFLRAALPAPGFEEDWELIQSFSIPREVTSLFEATAVGLLPAIEAGEPHTLIVRQRQGTVEIRAQRILIACGGLELTREHAQIPGTRPAGVITPMLAHQLLSRGYLPGKQAVVYGDSRYTQVTVQRLIDADIKATIVRPPRVAVAMEMQDLTISQPSDDHDSDGLPSITEGELVSVEGFPRLEKVTFRLDGQYFALPADTLIYGAGMLANTHWLKGSGINIGAYGTIQVDTSYQTNVPGIYAVGTVIAPSLDHAGSIAMGKEVASLLVGGRQ